MRLFYWSLQIIQSYLYLFIEIQVYLVMFQQFIAARIIPIGGSTMMTRTYQTDNKIVQRIR